MEMKIKTEKYERMTLEEFAILHDLTLCVCENYSESRLYYSAYFKDVEVVGLINKDSFAGTGETPTWAIREYTKNISTRLVVLITIAPITGEKMQRLIRCPLFINKEGKVL